MAEINQFCTEPITCYAQSGAADKLALSPNNNLVYIYKQQNSNWIEESVLGQHDLRVTSIDWAPKTNRIVTCSADRNAYVWTQQQTSSATTKGAGAVGGDISSQESVSDWKPTLVLLRINRAATCVKWSPNEDKFAVGTAAKLVCICYFESANDWWVSRHIKKPIKSTVTCIDWHPDNILLACGSTDYKSRIFSTYIKEVDQKSSLANSKASTWAKHDSDSTTTTTTNTTPSNDTTTTILSTTGALIHEFSNSGAWVHDVAYSPDGTKLAWVSHDSSISVVDSNHSMTVVTLKTRYLPFLSCVWVSQGSIVAAGHDCCPMLFSHQQQQQSNGQTAEHKPTQPVLKFIGRLDRSQKRAEDGQSAMRKFRDLDAKADPTQTNSVISGDSCLSTIHQNTIGQVRLYSKAKSVATVGLDGKFVVWSLDPSVV